MTLKSENLDEMKKKLQELRRKGWKKEDGWSILGL